MAQSIRDMVFVHVPKTGGNTVCNLFPGVRNIGHSSMRDHAFDEKDFVFAFVRNPYDRLVSTFFYLTQGGMNDSDKADCSHYIGNSDWPRFVEQFSKRPEYFKQQIHMKDQFAFLNVNRINYLGRYENINDHLSTLLKRVGLPLQQIGRNNSSAHRPYHYYYNQWIAMKVYRIYEEDFSRFTYCRQSWRSQKS